MLALLLRLTFPLNNKNKHRRGKRTQPLLPAPETHAAPAAWLAPRVCPPAPPEEPPPFRHVPSLFLLLALPASARASRAHPSPKPRRAQHHLTPEALLPPNPALSTPAGPTAPAQQPPQAPGDGLPAPRRRVSGAPPGARHSGAAHGAQPRGRRVCGVGAAAAQARELLTPEGSPALPETPATRLGWRLACRYARTPRSGCMCIYTSPLHCKCLSPLQGDCRCSWQCSGRSRRLLLPRNSPHQKRGIGIPPPCSLHSHHATSCADWI